MKKIEADKLMHFGFSMGISIITGLVGVLLGMNWYQTLYIGFTTGLAAGLGKEYGDKMNPNNKWDWSDVLADGLGALTGSAAAMVVGLY